MGRAADGTGATAAFSIELCGGTHVSRTGDIGLVSDRLRGRGRRAGVRRIEAHDRRCGARHHLAEREPPLARAARRSEGAAPRRCRSASPPCSRSARRLERELAEARKKLAMGGGRQRDGASRVRDVGGVKLMARAVDGRRDASDLQEPRRRGQEAGSAPASSPSSASPRTARRASWSASPTT